MLENKKDVERKDTEDFITEVLMKVPKGNGREMVLAITGVAASLITAQSKNSNTSNSPATT